LIINIIETKGSLESTRLLQNMLLKGIADMTKELDAFLKNHRAGVNTNTLLQGLTHHHTLRDEDGRMQRYAVYTLNNFYKTYVENFAKVFPTILVNHTSNPGRLQLDVVTIPPYFEYSASHQEKLKSSISNYFLDIMPSFRVDKSMLALLEKIPGECQHLVSLANSTPCAGSIDEQTSRYLFDYYVLRTLVSYIRVADQQNVNISEGATNVNRIAGEKRLLKKHVAELLILFLTRFNKDKKNVDLPYETVRETVHKLKEKEKNLLTDRLQGISQALGREGLDVESAMMTFGLGNYSQLLRRGLTQHDKEFYEQQKGFRTAMASEEANTIQAILQLESTHAERAKTEGGEEEHITAMAEREIGFDSENEDEYGYDENDGNDENEWEYD